MWTGATPVDWTHAATALIGRGWLRLERVVDEPTRAGLIEAAPARWAPLPEVEGSVRQGGLACGAFFDDAPAAVQDFGRRMAAALSRARPDVAPLPPFNEVQWGRSHHGVGFITAHRDPPGAGGVIAVATLWGHAVFRVWSAGEVTEWETDDGDLVLLRGHGWPTDGSVCPVHEVESPRHGDRMTMTLRHNRRGAGGDYFA